MTGNILDALAAHALERVEEKKRRFPLAELKRRLEDRAPLSGFPFEAALREPGLSVIAEVKKASPSKGVIAEHFPYVAIAKAYEAAGAACISVLTEPKWFLGDDRYLREIAASVSLPCIRKDFTVDPYLIYEARELGASAVLLICALLSRSELEEYLGIAEELGLTALVEAHNEDEVGLAAEVGARVIGINNRDLKSFSVDMNNSKRLRAAAPEHCLFVAESGVSSPADTAALRGSRVDAILVGEALMRAENKAELLKALRAGYAEG